MANNQNTVRVPPHSQDAEESVLGAILLDKDAVIAIAEFLDAGDFYDERYKDIFQACIDLYEERIPIDVLTVSDRLKKSKKNKNIKCPEPCIRQEELDNQLSSLIKSVSLPRDWAEELLKMAEKDFNNSAPSLTACVEEKKEEISSLSKKLERLLTGYLDQVIDEQDYRTEKSKLLLSKKSLEEEISTFSHKQNDWLAPFQNWLKDAQSLDKIASDSDLFAKKVCAKEIFGSNLLLGEKTVRTAEGGAPFRTQNSLAKTGETAWAALCAAHNSVSEKPLSSILVRLFDKIRTYFERN